jgi:hypothetical protein
MSGSLTLGRPDSWPNRLILLGPGCSDRFRGFGSLAVLARLDASSKHSEKAPLWAPTKRDKSTFVSFVGPWSAPRRVDR